MLQTTIAWRALPKASAKRNMSARDSPEPRSSASQERLLHLGFQFAPAGGARADEVAVHPVVLDQVLEHAVEESDVAAGMDLEEIVSDAWCRTARSRPPTAPSSAPTPARDTD